MIVEHLIHALLEMGYASRMPSSLPHGQGACVCNAGYCRQQYVVLRLKCKSSPGQAASSQQQLLFDERGRLVYQCLLTSYHAVTST